MTKNINAADSVLALIKLRRKNLGVCAIAKKIGCHPSTVSRIFKKNGISKPKLEPGRGSMVAKVALNQAMALFFLGLNREQIRKLIKIKSTTLKSYLLELIMEIPDVDTQPGQKKYIFNSEKWNEWARTLGKKYDLNELVQYIPITVEQFPNVSMDEKAFIRLLKSQIKETPDFVTRKMQKILGRKVIIEDGFIVTRGHKNQKVTIPTGYFRMA